MQKEGASGPSLVVLVFQVMILMLWKWYSGVDGEVDWFVAVVASLVGVWSISAITGCVILVRRDCAVGATWCGVGAASLVVGWLVPKAAGCVASLRGGCCCGASSLMSCSGRDLQQSASDGSVSSSMSTEAVVGAVKSCLATSVCVSVAAASFTGKSAGVVLAPGAAA
eukprot:3558653-Amphidinium_carterae.2